jgi:hypothetical protein
MSKSVLALETRNLWEKDWHFWIAIFIRERYRFAKT